MKRVDRIMNAVKELTSAENQRYFTRRRQKYEEKMKIKNRWFCNRPLSPASDESTNKNNFDDLQPVSLSEHEKTTQKENIADCIITGNQSMISNAKNILSDVQSDLGVALEPLHLPPDNTEIGDIQDERNDTTSSKRVYVDLQPLYTSEPLEPSLETRKEAPDWIKIHDETAMATMLPLKDSFDLQAVNTSNQLYPSPDLTVPQGSSPDEKTSCSTCSVICSPSVSDYSDLDPNFSLGSRSSDEETSFSGEESSDIRENFDLVNEISELHGNEVKESSLENSNENEVSQGTVESSKKPKDFCYYCEILVTNFARHIERIHSSEIDVQKALAKPPKSQERRALIASLRKKGNYLKGGKSCFRPMKRTPVEKERVPCPHCLGYYVRKQLWRHKRSCIERQSNSNSTHLLSKISGLKAFPELREKVFPKMRNDTISVTAQKDKLICAYGARYLKSHRDRHFVSVISRKMRELARLLIVVKQSENSVDNFFDLLHPRNYDLIVESTQKVAEYNKLNEFYARPSYALNMGTTLKQMCDVAIDFALKRKEIYSTIPGAEARSDLQTLQQLISSNWKYDVSSQASKNLSSNKWNKVTIVPLASDLKLLKTYLSVTANRARNDLEQDSHNEKSYRDLIETVFCRLILLNRKRPGELQRLKCCTYEQADNSQNYEEFSDAITPTEKILLKSFKCIVIQGKRDRGVPVLVSLDVQADIEVLLKYRKHFVSPNNPYLFCQLRNDGHIYGYKVLQKHAKFSGCKNPSALTSTRLRKHLATLSQIFNMTDNDLEQLATFMGHTTEVHRNSYRLPNDVYQTAKISKLLLLMEKGTAPEYKGKSLDEIEIDLEEDLHNKDLEDEKEEELEHDSCEEPISEKRIIENVSEWSKPANKRNCRKKIQRVPWTAAQKQVVIKHFKSHIDNKKPPKQRECEELISLHGDLLKNKNWLKIKVFVQNEYVKKKGYT